MSVGVLLILSVLQSVFMDEGIYAGHGVVGRIPPFLWRYSRGGQLASSFRVFYKTSWRHEGDERKEVHVRNPPSTPSFREESALVVKVLCRGREPQSFSPHNPRQDLRMSDHKRGPS